MPYILVRQKVEDYAKWKPFFDQHSATRQSSGSRGGRLFRNAHDPNELVVLFEWDDLEKARQFAQSEFRCDCPAMSPYILGKYIMGLYPTFILCYTCLWKRNR